MPIPFTCPYCGHETNMADEHAGRSGSCISCGKQISVPGEVSRTKKSNIMWIRPGYFYAAILMGIIAFCGTNIFYRPQSRESARIVRCKQNIRELVTCVLVNESSNGVFPPASGPISSDAEPSDPPMLIAEDWSWRVRILPELEEGDLYRSFHFDEPWNSEHNLTVAEHMPDIFQCPSDEFGFKEINGRKVPRSSYVMVSGPNAVGTVDGSTVSLDDVVQADGASYTLMIVEVHGDNRPAWTEPHREITLEHLVESVNREAGIISVGGNHPGGFNVGFCDGSVSTLSDEITGEELVFMGHWNDGNIVAPENY